jgi:hypothetical protein
VAAPNLGNATTVTGKTTPLAVTTTATAIASAASGQLAKVITLTVTNVNATTTADVTVDLYRSTTAYPHSKLITVPPKSTIVLVSKDAPVYLEENDAFRLTASVDSYLVGLASYEVVS